MDLLTFAHRGEAKAFFQEFPFKPQSFAFEGLYKSSDFYLLITGEGIQSTSEKLSAVLGAFDDIEKVFNLGVCGSLEEKFSEGQIHPIRTCYLEKNSGMEFKSYSTQGEGIDCISAHKRVLNEEYAKYLSYFAPLVDREVWAIGSVCNLFKKRFYSYKYISDYADGEDICQVVSSKAEDISDSLLTYFKKLHFTPEIKGIFPEIKGLHFTTSQKRLYNSLVKKLKIKGLSIEKIFNLYEINALPLSPKQKAARVINELESALFPFNDRVKSELQDIINPLEERGLKIKLPKNFEIDDLEVGSTIKNQQDLNQLIGILKEFPLDKIQKVFKGNVDV